MIDLKKLEFHKENLIAGINYYKNHFPESSELVELQNELDIIKKFQNKKISEFTFTNYMITKVINENKKIKDEKKKLSS